MKLIKIQTLLLTFLISFFSSVSFSSASITCSSCYVSNCQCSITDCSAGTFGIYTTKDCSGFPLYYTDFSGGTVSWSPSQAVNYSARAFCNSINSACTSIQVSSTTTTTSTPCCTVCPTCPPCPPDTPVCTSTTTTQSCPLIDCIEGYDLDPVTCQCVPTGCVLNSPNISVSPKSVTAKLGDTMNFTANVTNMDSANCSRTPFVFNGSKETFILSNISFNLFNFSANPDHFVLAPGEMKTVNFSYGTFFAFATNYTLNVTATDFSNRICGDPPNESVCQNLTVPTHSGKTSISYSVSESLVPTSFKCIPITVGHRCDFGYITNYLQDAMVLFLVSNSRGKVVSSGGATAVLAGTLTFNFYCTTFGTGNYTISWVVYKGSDANLTTPILYSTTSQDKTLTC